MSKLERIKRINRVARARGYREGISRAKRKLSLLRRAKDLSEAFTYSEKPDVCACSRVSVPHVHTFGSCVAVSTSIVDKRTFVARLMKSHTFRKAGNPHTWGAGGVVRDAKNNARMKVRAVAIKHAAALDKRMKARKLLESPNRANQISACNTLGLDSNCLPPRDIWKAALSRKRGKRPGKSVSKIQVYRAPTF